jgi:RimJ/RimL family protein N-acetyltransferase
MERTYSDVDLRPATGADFLLLFKWANDPETRRNSINAAPVSWDEHLQWVDQVLSQDRYDTFIVVWRGDAVGVVRLSNLFPDVSKTESVGEMSITIDQERRGRGLDPNAIKAVCRRAPYRTYLALVKPDNEAAKSAFRAAGFKQSTYTSSGVIEVLGSQLVVFTYDKEE